MNILNFISMASAECGGSYSITTGRTNPETGYMVSLADHEVTTEQFPSDEQIRQYISEHSAQLWQDNRYFGLWLTGTTWYMDVSENVADLDKAIAMGKANKQLAIWDCANKCAIML